MALRLTTHQPENVTGGEGTAAVQRATSAKALERAAFNRLRLLGRGDKSRIASSVKRAGLRTSGVGQIPLQESRLGTSLARSNLAQSLAQLRLGQIGSSELSRQAFEQQRVLNREDAARAMERLRSERKGAFQSALIGGLTGVVGSYLGGPAFGAATAAANSQNQKKKKNTG